jgi:VWFA-related protein
MSLPSRAIVAAVVCALSVESAAPVRAQNPAAVTQLPPQSAPTFRTGVRVIDLDVFVTDKDGKFVGNLTKDDFEIVEDGRQQEIQSFSYIDLPLPAAVPATANGAPRPEPDVLTNTTPQDRIYVIVMDSPSTQRPPGEHVTGLAYSVLAKRVAAQFIKESLGPGDQVAVVHTQGTFTDSQTFTSNRQLLLASIDRYGRGQSGDIDNLSAPEQVARHLASFKALQDVAERLGAIGGRRKAIVWLGAQLLYAIPTCDSPTCRTIRGAYPNILTAYRDAIGAANRNNVAIYAVDPSGLQAELGETELDRRAGLMVVAEDTGGQSLVNTNNFAGGFQSIVRDNSTYYILGYSPATEYRDGKFHDVRVRVKKPGLTVRARKGYFAPSSDTRAASLPPLPAGVTEAARSALRMPISVNGLQLELFAAPLKGTGSVASIVVGGRVTGELALTPRSQIALSYQVFTKDNKVQAGEYKVLMLDLREMNRERAAENGLSFVERLSLPPGSYELRFVVDQPGGNVGSVNVSLAVPTFDEPLALSGILLGALSASDTVTLRADPELRSALGADPTTVRRFPAGDLLAALVEVYSNDARVTGDDLQVKAIVTTAAGVRVSTEAATATPGASGRSIGRWAFKGEIGLGDLQPGDYVLTMEAVSRRRPNQPVRRQIPFTVVD